MPRAHYAERRLSALTYRCDHAHRERDRAGVIEYASQIIELDCLRERAHRLLMTVQYRLGQRALAMRQYRRCADALERELGVRPSRETQLLFEAIRDDTPLPAELPLLAANAVSVNLT